MTILEATTSGRGPGHDILGRVQEAWLLHPDGSAIRVEAEGRRVFDPRSDLWKQAFLDACSATLESYPYDGLFLDQCTVFAVHHPDESVRAEMRAHLQEVLTEVRRRHPTAILIGNSAYKWKGLNGEMSEDREQQFAKELRPIPGHAAPNINLGLIRLKENTNDDKYVRERLIFICSLGAFFTAASNYQMVPWFSVYDEVISIAAQLRLKNSGPSASGVDVGRDMAV